MNKVAVDFIKQHEGLRLSAYQDQAGIWTIGYGHTGAEVHQGLIWDTAQAETALANDVGPMEGAIAKLVSVHLSEMSWAALISFAFNLGAHALAISDALKSINAGDYLTGARQICNWDHVGQIENKGLLIRRFEEAALFLKGLP